jgi:ferric-dicitrate binding protein FerR (iron transport regulator)
VERLEWNELDLLATRLTAGELEEPERSRLVALLQDDRDARDRFRFQMVLHALLEAEFAPSLAGQKDLDVSADDPRRRGASARQMLIHRLRRTRSRLLVAFAAAACLVFVVSSSLLPIRPPREVPSETNAGSELEVAPACLAEVAGERDARWAPGQEWQLGAKLRAGDQLRMISGQVEIAMQSGAMVLMQGACRLRVISDARVELSDGRVVCRLDRDGASLEVTTPTAVITDLGTEFVVHVSDLEETELHVLSGKVQLAKRTDTDASQQLIEGQSRRVSASGSISTIPFRPTVQSYATASAPVVPETVQPNRMAGLPVVEGLCLHLSAAARFHLDGAGRVQRWDSLIGNDLLASDVQPISEFRPTWIPDAWSGLPGIRFDGYDDSLVTRPFELGPNITVMAVCKPIDGQVANFQVQRSPNLVLGFSDEALYGRSWSFRERRGHGESAGKIAMQTPMVVGYRWQDGGKASLDHNAVVLGTAAADHVVKGRAQCRIGRHPDGTRVFKGILSELLVYNVALSDDDMATVHRALASYYGIEIETKASTSPPVP